MIFSGLFKANEAQKSGRTLYDQAVTQARLPVFYAELDVPDTIDGRFEAIVLHVWLILRRLRRETSAPAPAKSDGRQKISQAMFDAMITDMDRSLREMGVGDLRVGKRVKAMARSFYGHVHAYDEGFDGGDMAAALRRNVYGAADTADSGFDRVVQALARYVERAASSLENQPFEDIIGGNIKFVRPLGGESR